MYPIARVVYFRGNPLQVRQPRWQWGRVSIFAVLCVGIFFSIAEFRLLRSLEADRARAAFERASRERFDELQSDLQLSVIRVTALEAFCESTYPVTRTAFDVFASHLVSGHDSAIQALEWVPKVSRGERRAVEKTARDSGISNFEIRERTRQDELARSSDHNDYFPVLWVQPYAGNERAVGFDVATGPRRREALMRAAASGRPVASGRVVLVQETGDQYGVLIFQPVFQQAPALGARRLLGFALGVLRVGAVVEKHGAQSGIDITVLDVITDGAEQLYPKQGKQPRPPSDFTQSRTITVGGRTWLLAASPVPGAFPLNRTYSWLGLAVSLLITLLSAAYMWNSRFRRAKVEKLVEQRTADLSAAIISLEQVHVELSESELRYRRLVEDSPNAIVVERGGKIVLVNRNAVKMFGFDATQDPAGHSLTEFVAPERKAIAEELIAKLRSQDMQIPPRETRLLHPNGTIMEAEIAASSYVHSGERFIQVILRDISLRKQAEAENARLILAIEQAAESIVITDVTAQIVYVNPAFERISGYTRNDVIGRNPRFLKSGRQSEEFYAALWKTLTAGESWSGYFVNRMKNGRLYTEEATISPVVNSSGEIINYVAVKRDVTSELELRQQLLQSRKMDAVGRLAGGVAHDFNNMIMVMTSYAELLASELDEGDPRHEHIQHILRAADRSSALTRQLLTFSRKQVLEPRVLDCNAILSETISMIRRLIGENIELTCDLASGLWRVKADADQIGQVILNLCVNSRDAMPNGGSLTLASRNFPLDEGYVEISVTDTGVGIPLELQEKLFEPFFTTKELGKGTGLGLATVYGIVEQSGGYIRVESAPGEGATFRVYLPRCRDAADSAEEPVAVPTKKAAREVVLLVEDEEALRDAMAEQLRAHGFSVFTAGDGVEAMQTLAHNPGISTLITDLVMPRMGGRELVRSATEAFPHLRVLVLSGYADQSFRDEDCNGYPSDFLQKPFSLRALIARLTELGRRPHITSKV